MTLYEIGLQYKESAKPIRARLRELRGMLKTATDPEEIWNIKRRIQELTPMLTDCNKLANYCMRYYEEGYFIGNGAFDRYERIGKTTAKQAAVGDHPTHLDKRINTPATTGGARMSAQWKKLCEISKGVGRL